MKRQARVLVAFLVALLLSGCAQVRFGIATAQRLLPPHPMAVAAVDAARDLRCDDQPTTLDAAYAALTVPIRETRWTAGKQMAAPNVLGAARGFDEQPSEVQLAKLRHELVHYCQRKTVPGFDQLWLLGRIDEPCQVERGRCVGVLLPLSDFRAAFEIAAWRASHGRVPDDFAGEYLLHDLVDLDAVVAESLALGEPSEQKRTIDSDGACSQQRQLALLAPRQRALVAHQLEDERQLQKQRRGLSPHVHVTLPGWDADPSGHGPILPAAWRVRRDKVEAWRYPRSVTIPRSPTG